MAKLLGVKKRNSTRTLKIFVLFFPLTSTKIIDHDALVAVKKNKNKKQPKPRKQTTKQAEGFAA